MWRNPKANRDDPHSQPIRSRKINENLAATCVPEIVWNKCRWMQEIYRNKTVTYHSHVRRQNNYPPEIYTHVYHSYRLIVLVPLTYHAGIGVKEEARNYFH